MDKSIQIWMGLDFGTKRIGVAIGQTITRTANPITTLINNSQGEPDWPGLKKIVQEWKVQGIVLGIPYERDGSVGEIAKLALIFFLQLQTNFPHLSIHQMDERYTSYAARSELKFDKKNKRVKSEIDKLSAKFILESWLTQGKVTD